VSKQFDVLAIDDEQVIIDSISKLCSAEGWQVDGVLDATAGLKKMDRNQYSLIICDIMMPDLDGFQFLEQTRSKNNQTPIIITTGYSTVENAVRSLNSGAIDYLAKPFTVEELVSIVQRGLNYGKIMTSFSDTVRDSMPYVPCPPRYYQFGYSTWASVEEDGSLKIGVTDLFLETISKITQIELFNPESEIVQGNVCAHIETDDQLIHSVLSPISGRVIRQNQSILDNRNLMEKDPYFAGWIYTIIPSDLEYELNHLTPCSSDRL
jgi:CheY-like chemotaxis protein/glycine cleavage system H lipoate-binding protein